MSTNKLKSLGLSKNESKVYLAFLRYGENMASTIANKIGLDKSSCYRAADRLVEKGLLIENPRKRGTTYSPTDPKFLKEIYKEKKIKLVKQGRDLDKFIENLKKLSKSESSTFAKVYKGLDAHFQLLEEAIEKRDTIIREKFPLDIEPFVTKEYNKFIRKYIKSRIKKNVSIKQLYNLNQVNKDFSDIMVSSKKLLKEIRSIPHELETENYFRIYRDTVLIYTFEGKKDFTIIKIKNAKVANLMSSLFDFIFSRSAKIYAKQKLPTKQIACKKVASLGIGSWGVGGYSSINPYNNESYQIQQIVHSINLGQNYIDTSINYAERKSVEIISKAIRNIPRDKLFINSKLVKYVENKKDIKKQCDKYLEILDTDYLDSFQIHNPLVWKIPFEKVIREMDKLIDKGKVRYLSVSNFNVPLLKKALKYTRHGVASHEIHYNLIVRANEKNGVIDFCKENNITMIAYQPTRRGAVYKLEEEALLSKLSKKYKMTLGQLAINWLVSKPNMMVITKSTNGSHINENVAALNFEIRNEDHKKLDQWRLDSYQLPDYDKTHLNEEKLQIFKI